MAESPPTVGPTVVLFAGGGSGGHLYPGVAVATELVRRRPDVRPLFLCTTRDIDRTILGPTGFEFVEQPIVPPHRSVGGLLRFWTRWRATHELVRNLLRDDARGRPVMALGLGGYAAGVAVKLVAKAGLPAALVNPDVVPGQANRYLMHWCRLVFCGFEQTLGHVPASSRDKCRVTGCPIRPEFAALPSKADAASALGLDPRLSTLVVTGASQGAKTVNDAVLETLRRLRPTGNTPDPLQGWQILHLAGRDHADDVRTAYRQAGFERLARVVDFTPDMHVVWASADFAVSRSGAGSCAELLAAGVPVILLPYPFHKDKHQTHNAQVLVDAGAGVTVDDTVDAAATAQAMLPTFSSLLTDADRRRRMADAARGRGRSDAASAVAAHLADLLPTVPTDTARHGG